MERIRCCKCGKSVSSEVPEGTIVRAWVECPECVAKGEPETCTQGKTMEEDKGLELWIRMIPHTKICGVMKELIEMLMEQEMIAVREDGVPYHAHTGDLLY